MNYIDGVTIINSDGTILFTVKFNPDIDKKMEESIVGRKLFDVFYNLDKSNSSLYECMEKEMLIERKGQLVKNLFVEDTITDNISYPIKHGGIVVGAIELSKVILDNENNSKGGKEIKTVVENAAMNLKPKVLNLGYNATYYLEDIICKDKKMKELVDYSRHIAKSSSPVFITGETGTGKELFAHGIHNASNRKDKPFIAQNCSAVPENLLESIFFGTSKGSYTGAIDKKGLFEACDGGTLFLDELHCMPIYLQSKLLRAIESGAVRRIGENEERKFDVRVIAATNITNNNILSQENIRHDLYYRLSVVNINIPPLRERIEDIKILYDFFIKKYNRIFEKNITSVSPEVNSFMLTYGWPGNVRELENFIESAVLNVSDDKTTLESKEANKMIKSKDAYLKTKPIKTMLEDMEIKLLDEALMISRGNVKKAAEYLEIPRQTLQQKMKKYKLKYKMP
jgi:arginine utilization regulatory protein